MQVHHAIVPAERLQVWRDCRPYDHKHEWFEVAQAISPDRRACKISLPPSVLGVAVAASVLTLSLMGETLHRATRSQRPVGPGRWRLVGVSRRPLNPSVSCP